MRRRLRLAALCLMCLAGSITDAAEPTLRNVDVRGLRIGGTTTVTVDGTELTSEPRLVLPFDGAICELKEATATRAVFEVTLGEQVTPGVYHLRLATAEGVSAPVVVGVDRLPQLPINAEIDSLPVALHGQVGGSATVETRFTGTVGQVLTVEVEAQRLGGQLRPVLHLFDERRVQLAWAWPSPTLAGDARLTATLPADGVYTVRLHDAEYAAPAPNHFRLKIGDWECAGQVFPPAVERGKPATFELSGSAGKQLVEAAPSGGHAWIALPWADATRASGLRPFVIISETPEVVERGPTDDPASQQELPAAPVAVSGRLSVAGEEDAYRLPVEPGSKLRFEVFAERYAAPVDAVLIVRNDQGQQLARSDEGPGTTDPMLEYTVPADLDSLVVAVSDQHGRGGDRSIYRLVVEASEPVAPRRDFRLLMGADRLNVPHGGRRVLPVLVERRGYEGPVQLAFDGLPDGAAVEGSEVPAGAEGTLVTVTATGDAAAPSVVGVRGACSEGQIERTAAFDQHPLGELQPWLSEELAVALTPLSGFGVEWGELSSDARLVLAGRMTLPVQLTRPEGDATAVRLSLLVGQNVPRLNNGNPDLNRAIRLEQPTVEVAPDKTAAELTLLVPPSLPGTVYDLAVRAELLSANKQTVLATTCTPVRRLDVLNPIGIQLAGGPRFEAAIAPQAGTTVVLTGQVERRAGFNGDVAVAVSGLPAGARAAAVTVKPKTTDFELTIAFPANVQPGEVPGVKLSATTTAAANQRVTSNEIDVPIVLVASD